MLLSKWNRIVVMTVDTRDPDFAQATTEQLLAYGADKVQIFLNGRGREGLDPAQYSLVHEGEAPAPWRWTLTLWDYARAYRTVIAQAIQDGVERLSVAQIGALLKVQPERVASMLEERMVERLGTA